MTEIEYSKILLNIHIGVFFPQIDTRPLASTSVLIWAQFQWMAGFSPLNS